VYTIDLESPIVSIRYHTENDLLAVVCDDLGIRVIDLETKKVVREFWGHRNRITDFVSRITLYSQIEIEQLMRYI